MRIPLWLHLLSMHSVHSPSPPGRWFACVLLKLQASSGLPFRLGERTSCQRPVVQLCFRDNIWTCMVQPLHRDFRLTQLKPYLVWTWLREVPDLLSPCPPTLAVSLPMACCIHGMDSGTLLVLPCGPALSSPKELVELIWPEQTFLVGCFLGW